MDSNAIIRQENIGKRNVLVEWDGGDRTLGEQTALSNKCLFCLLHEMVSESKERLELRPPK